MNEHNNVPRQMNDQPRFIVDANCGRLATWLRVLGFDTTLPPALPDPELLRRSAAEGRIIVTRDRGVAGSRLVRFGPARAVLIHAEAYAEQVREIVRTLDLLPLIRPFTRCPACNGDL